MPIHGGVINNTDVYVNGVIMPGSKVVVGSAVTNASGIARFYYTDTGTSTGTKLINNVRSWSADITTGVQVNSRTSTLGSNFVDVTVTNLAFSGVVLLGINLLGAVTTNPVAGASVQFIVVGD
jgi:hypothetical protein